MKLPAEPKPEQCRVTIDSREQLPYDLSPLTAEIGGLPTGDYGLAGEFAGLVCVERKTLPDFVSSCTGGRDRFEREIQRMLAYPARAIVVEGTWTDILDGHWAAHATPKMIQASVASFTSRGIPVSMCGCRVGGERFAGLMLWSVWRREYRRLRAVVATMESGS